MKLSCQMKLLSPLQRLRKTEFLHQKELSKKSPTLREWRFVIGIFLIDGYKTAHKGATTMENSNFYQQLAVEILETGISPNPSCLRKESWQLLMEKKPTEVQSAILTCTWQLYGIFWLVYRSSQPIKAGPTTARATFEHVTTVNWLLRNQ